MKWLERSIWILVTVFVAGFALYSHVLVKHYRMVAGAAIVDDVGTKSLILQLMEQGKTTEAQRRLQEYLHYSVPMMQDLASEYGYGRPGNAKHTYYLRVTERLQSLESLRKLTDLDASSPARGHARKTSLENGQVIAE